MHIFSFIVNKKGTGHYLRNEQQKNQKEPKQKYDQKCTRIAI